LDRACYVVVGDEEDPTFCVAGYSGGNALGGQRDAPLLRTLALAGDA
jgi:hypothetical protein